VDHDIVTWGCSKISVFISTDKFKMVLTQNFQSISLLSSSCDFTSLLSSAPQEMPNFAQLFLGFSLFCSPQIHTNSKTFVVISFTCYLNYSCGY